METLQSWALCITFSAVGALLVHALVPKGATEKAIRVMISLFFVIRNSIAVFIRKRDYAHVCRIRAQEIWRRRWKRRRKK